MMGIERAYGAGITRERDLEIPSSLIGMALRDAEIRVRHLSLVSAPV
jgi:hypothetical protein